LKREGRKAAVAAYKDRKVAAGIYVVRCAATAQQWAGSAPDLRDRLDHWCEALHAEQI
jgi:hypothetical protein